MWSSNNIQNEISQTQIKNNVWKKINDGWIIVADMDEFLCITESELYDEMNNGTTMISVKGIDMIGESKTTDLSDINLETIEKYVESAMESKALCFLRPDIIDMNYTIVLIDQTTEPPNPKREVTGIYSPATHINNKSNKTNFLVSVVIDKIKEAKTNTMQICIGLSAYDLSTGEGSVYETYSKSNDVLIGLDDTLRFLDNYPPREIILENN